MAPIPPSRIFARISYLPSMSVPGTGKAWPSAAEIFDCTVPARQVSRKRTAAAASLVTIIAMAPTTTGTAAEAETASGGSLAALFATARPAQWVKNLVLALPFLFGGALAKPHGWALAAGG